MHLVSALVLLSAAASLDATPFPALRDLNPYSPTWSTPGPDASASMPIGNGELGLNVWTEPNGDIAFYVSRTDSWSEASRLMKLGRVRISFDPPIVQPRREFSQRLDLAAGVLRIASSVPGDDCVVEVFVHPDHPVAYINGVSHTPRRVTVSLELWRTARTQLTGTGPDAELTSSWTMHDAPMDVWESADLVLDDPSRLVWCHRNEDSVVPLSIELQGLGGAAASVPDVLLHRTFGGAISAGPEGYFRRASPTTIESNGPRERFDIRIVGHTAQTPTVGGWTKQVDAIGEACGEPAAARVRTNEWWREFWDRSYIFVEGDAVARGVPVNALPITLGQDSAGGNTYRGEINRVGMYAKVYDDAGVLRMSRGRLDQPPPFRERAVSFVSTDPPGKTAPPSAPTAFPDGFTLDAWIKPAPDLRAARILDKITPGGSDGFLFDIQPGGTLRLVVGKNTLTAPGVVALGAWNRLAATYDPSVDQLRLFAGGREVAASARNENLSPSRVTQGYVLQRWMQACAGRGGAPIKFNGSIFTVDAKYTNGNDKVSPDYRRWGDCFWWQNTRLPYHAMLATGDFDMMDPLFDLYIGVLPVCEARAAIYHHVKGAYFPETMNIFGLYSNGDYGWDRSGHKASDVLCPWWQWAWNQGPELVSLMLDRYDYTRDDAFAAERLVPMARSVLPYFDTRFKRDENGTLVISPTQALETHWHGVVNDMPVVAGLHDITSRLLALPDSLGTPEDRALWERIHAALPPIPTREDDGVALFAPAEKYDPSRQNIETPELANVFPHRLVGLDSPAEMVEMARETYRRRHDKATSGWTQDGQFAALLGMTDEAKANILAKAANSNPKHRFPAMWGPNFDWLPDQTHGGNLMHVLQCMLLQPRGDKVLLLPAWPREWNVSFKLHAPRNTVVECEYRDGEVVRLEVTPESRRGDVEVMIH